MWRKFERLQNQQGDAGASGAGAGAGAGGGAGAGAAGGTPWYGEIPAERADLKQFFETKQFANPIAMAESYINSEKLLGAPADQVLRLPKPEDKAAWDGVWNKLGRPEKAEGYELPVPQGDDGEFAKVAAAAFHAAGVPKAAAQAIAKHVNEHVAAQMKARTDALETRATQELTALKAELGEKWQQTEEFARRGMKAYGEKAGLDETKIAALELAIGTASMVKLFHALGETTGEHDFVGGGGDGGFSLNPAQARAKLDEYRQQRIENKISEKDWLGHMDKLGPIAAKAA